MDSAVPYSLSDIQLPDSPSKIVKPAVKASSKKETLPLPPTKDSDKESQSDSDMHKNGLKSGSLSKAKSVLDDASNKKKISIMESKRSDSQNAVSKGVLKISDIVDEPENLSKSNQLKNKKNSEEKISKTVEEKSFKSKDKYTDSRSSSSTSSEESSTSNSRKERKQKSKISVKHSKLSKRRSRSSSSSSASSSQSQERIPEKLSKDSTIHKKKMFEPHASRIVKHQAESFNPKTSQSKRRASSSSSQSSSSREASPIEQSKKDVKKSVLPDASKSSTKHGEKSLDLKVSKSRSRSPSSSRIQKSIKQSKEDTKKSFDLDFSEDVKKHSKNSSDRKSSKSRSRSPSRNRSSRSRDESPVKSSKYGKKLFVPDSPKIPREHRTSSSDKKNSKSRSRSPISRQNYQRQKKSPLKKSKDDFTKQDVSEPSSISRKRNSSGPYQKNSKSRSRSPASKQNSETGERILTKLSKKEDISDKNTSKDRSRSPSKNQSRRSPKKEIKEDAKKTSMQETSRKSHKESVIEKNTSKSRSRSPSSSQSRERSPPKTLKASRTRKLSKSRSGSPSTSRSSQSPEKSPEKLIKRDAEKTPVPDASRTSRKRQTSGSDQKFSKSRSRSSSRSPPPHHTLELFLSKKQRVAKASKEMTKSVKTDVSQPAGLRSDPPRKKLKINRNNIVISSFGPSEKVSVDEQKKISSKSSVEKTSKLTPSSPKKEQRESITTAQPEVVEPEMGEIIENSPEVKYEPRKINFPGRKLSRKSSEDQTSSEPKSKKSKWGKFASSQKSSQAINISSDSLKNWFPEFKLVSEPSVVNDSMPEESPPIKEEIKLSFPVKIEEELVKQSSTNDNHQIKDEPDLEMTDSSCPVSKIVFIQNLVRPFTLLQLNELLRQTGSFVEEDFWIDKIKSKCFVTYATEEEAIKTRNALNGVRWPSSNPKILIAEFSTEEEFEHHRSGKDAQKPTLERLPEVQETYEEKTPQSVDDHRRKDRDSDKRKERDRYRMQAPVREWDKDKVLQDSPDREKQEKNIEGFRGSDKKDKKDTKKRTNEDTPAKLLDDLFQKTKSAPCIYWLPLTEAQVLEHEESKRIRRLEREKRNQQREKEESEQRNKRSRPDNRTREMEHRRSTTRSRSPTSRRR